MHARKTILPLLMAALAACPHFRIYAQDFTETVKTVLGKAEPTALSVPGSDPGWFFLRKELEHVSQGDLAAVADLKAINKEGTDPLPVIAKYVEELKALGVEVLLVPVPPKAAIYPEKLDAAIDSKTVPSLAPFYAKLQATGATVLDLEAVYKEQRALHPDKALYCATDSHWSPYGAQLAAQHIAAKYKDSPFVKEATLADLITLPEEALEFHGDLLTDAQKGSVTKEKLPLVRAGLRVAPDGKAVTTVESDPNSPLLVIGDSHLQVFRKGGSMLATQGGVIDHLNVGLSAAVEEISMQAGGADGPRVEIARATAKNPDFWAKKKVLVWVFTAREFTEGKWRVLPAKVVKR